MDDLPYKIIFSPNKPISPNHDGKEWQEYRISDKETGATSTPIMREGTQDEIIAYIEEVMEQREKSITCHDRKKSKGKFKRGKSVNLLNRKANA